MMRTAVISLCAAGGVWLAGCTHTVQMAAPKEPITINLNVKVEHEIRVKVDKELDEVISKDSPLF